RARRRRAPHLGGAGRPGLAAPAQPPAEPRHAGRARPQPLPAMSVRRRASRSMSAGLASLLALLAASIPAHAQDDARSQAAEHFDRGIAFFNEQRFDAALA